MVPRTDASSCKSFSLPWFAILGAHKALEHDLGIFAAICVGLLATTAGGVSSTCSPGSRRRLCGRRSTSSRRRGCYEAGVYAMVAVLSAGRLAFFRITLDAQGADRFHLPRRCGPRPLEAGCAGGRGCGGPTRAGRARVSQVLRKERNVMDFLDDMWTRLVHDLIARITGRMKFRLVLQPLMASIFAIRAWLNDAKTGKPPSFWSLLRIPRTAPTCSRTAGRVSARCACSRLCSTSCIRIIAERFVYPGEAIIVAIILAIVPYLILRGLVTRLARPK